MRIPKSEVPAGQSGVWAVVKFTVDEAGAKFHNLRASMSPGGRGISAGDYTSLRRNGKVIMSDTPAEIRDHEYFVMQASGDVLINGLGLGVCSAAVMQKAEVESVTVIEQSSDVIALVKPWLKDPDGKLTVIEDDAFSYKPPIGRRYNAVWHDIWDDICADNLRGMTALHRRYGRRTDWQGSWCKALCQRQ